MSDRDFLTLDPELSALLDAERPIPAAPDGARARVFASVAATVGLPHPPPVMPPGSPAPVPPVARPAMPVGPSGNAGPAGHSPLLKFGFTTLAGALVGGGLIYFLMQPHQPPVSPVPSAAVTVPAFEGPLQVPSRGIEVLPPSSASAASVPGVPVAPLMHPHHKTASHAVHPAHETAAPESGLAAERALLDQARSSLALSDLKAATAAIHAHERRFPDGQLVEERESIAIRTLVAAGQGREARARGEAFRKRFPTSMHLPAVDATLQSTP